jgi:hypothetical protein
LRHHDLPAGINSQAALAKYILSRPEWTSRPTVYPSSLSVAFARQTARHGRGHARAISTGKPVVLTPGDLAVRGAHYSDAVITLIARVASRTELPEPRWNQRQLTAVLLAAPITRRCIFGLLAEPIHAKQETWSSSVSSSLRWDLPPAVKRRHMWWA